MRILVRVLLGVLTVALIAVGVVLVLGSRAAAERVELPKEDFAAGPSDSSTIAEGDRLVTLYQCRDCHGAHLEGTDFVKGMPFANIPAPNLTAGGIGPSLSDVQWEGAVRHGIGADGRRLFIMPSEAFAGLANSDLSAIIVYARSLPAEQSMLVERSIGPAGRAAALFAPASVMLSHVIDHGARHPASSPDQSSTDYGAYLARACVACHGADYGGTSLAFANDLRASDLTPRNATGVSSWSEEQFVRAMKEGVRPDGTKLSDVMPWRAFGQYTPAELGALYRFMKSLSPARSSDN
jgi:cytochrome c553